MPRTVLSVVLALTVFGGSTAAAVPQTETDVAGVYRCQGMNPDGTPYEGIVEIARIDSTYRVHWKLSNDVNVLGVGIYSAGVLAVSYFGGAPGVVVYRIDGGRLIGEWTIGGAEGTVYSETLTKVPAAELRTPAGNAARGRVAGRE